MSPLVQKVLQSIFFRKAQQKAYSYIKDRNRLLHLLQQVGRHINSVGQQQANAGLVDSLHTMVRLVNAYRQGSYRNVSWQTLVKIVAVLIYFVLPLDFLPDVLPILGFTDDFALIIWAFRSFSSEINAFKAWESQYTAAEPIL